MNETIGKWINFGVMLLIIAAFIVAAMFMTGKANEWFSEGSEKISRAEQTLVNQDLENYNNKDVSGSQVMNLIRQYKSDSSIGIFVSTGKAATWYGMDASTIDSLKSVDSAASYKAMTDASSNFYINPSGLFHGTIQYDKNKKVAAVLFTQK